MKGLASLIRRDLRAARSGSGGAGIGLVFFLLVVCLFPFAVGPMPQTLARIAGGVIWVAAMLASLLSLESLFQPDLEDGTLDQLLSSGVTVETVVVARMISHWLTAALPVIVLTPVAGVLLNLPTDQMLLLLASLLIGTPAVTAIGTIAAALTAGLRRAGLLMSLIILPLILPVLIFGVGVLDFSVGATALKLLAAISLLAVGLSPFAAAAGLRLALE